MVSFFLINDNDGNNDTTSDSYIYRIVFIVWYIWKDKCNLFFQNIKSNAHSTIMRIQNLVQKCDIVVASTSHRINQKVFIKERLPRYKGYIKIIIDASYMYYTKNGDI